MSGVDIHAGPIGEVRAASTTSGGTALTTTASFIAFPTGTRYLTLIPRNVVTAVVVRYALNPYLIVFKTTDALAAAGNLTEASEALQDSDTGTSLSMNSFNTAANNNYLYIGSHAPFRGVRVIIGNTNSAGGSTATVKYRKSDATWANITATDGTKSTDTFRQTGDITWTVPTDWIARSIASIMATDSVAIMASAVQPWYLTESEMYWVRYETDTLFDATVTATGMLAMARSTTYGEFSVDVGKEFRIHKGHHGTGCLEALTDAGTCSLIVEAATLGVGSKFS